VSFATIILCVASQQVFVVVSFVIDSVRKLLDTPSYGYSVFTVTLLNCVFEVIGSNRSREPAILTEVSHDFLRSLQANSKTVPPPPIHHSNITNLAGGPIHSFRTVVLQLFL
jgi:hypothetical protein